jgi:hypothetical protein
MVAQSVAEADLQMIFDDVEAGLQTPGAIVCITSPERCCSNALRKGDR